jgi:hypothetical protein
MIQFRSRILLVFYLCSIVWFGFCADILPVVTYAGSEKAAERPESRSKINAPATMR